MPSIALSPEDHYNFTEIWRNSVKYGSKPGIEKIVKGAVNAYKDDPKLLGAAIYTMVKNYME